MIGRGVGKYNGCTEFGTGWQLGFCLEISQTKTDSRVAQNLCTFVALNVSTAFELNLLNLVLADW